ncbi:iron-sulfur cluster repair di-iron protein [Paraliobacillus quinghaiensis]|uniref:Iron-sulfur cluster repair di-iron protein n=1 Tax=Paraliobacillus quinghaiensis TaxID=470815 RepID=A0A917WSF6_9BACI|nr:iron-sulfur cluster repair di-iron protein [Paraliobacillus quinghaiensis]GGM27578.1 iron-sulfur cluster repair di-iron protein [Paraliobacillus quinghaiensis]
MQFFQIDDTPADIVKTFPKASDLFKKERIDFCCGGDKPLRETLEKRQIDGEMLLHALNESYKDWKDAGNIETDWNKVSSSELIDHILERHHYYLQQELEPLSQFVTKIFRVHGQNHPHLKDLHKVYHEFKAEIEAHLIEEENELFPLVRQYEETQDLADAARIQELNKNMEQEHQVAGDLLREMHTITNGFVPPEGACNSYRITYARLAELETNTFEHIHLENNILFKK